MIEHKDQKNEDTETINAKLNGEHDEGQKHIESDCMNN